MNCALCIRKFSKFFENGNLSFELLIVPYLEGTLISKTQVSEKISLLGKEDRKTRTSERDPTEIFSGSYRTKHVKKILVLKIFLGPFQGYRCVFALTNNTNSNKPYTFQKRSHL